MKLSLFLSLTLSMATLLTGCGNLVKSGAIFEAQNALNEKAYAEALENTEIAESLAIYRHQTTPSSIIFERSRWKDWGVTRKQCSAINMCLINMEAVPTRDRLNVALRHCRHCNKIRSI